MPRIVATSPNTMGIMAEGGSEAMIGIVITALKNCPEFKEGRVTVLKLRS
jgi:hypothetical protein